MKGSPICWLCELRGSASGCEEADACCPALALCLGTAAWWFVGLCCFPLIISQPALGCGSSASWGVPTANPLTVSFGLTVLQTGPSADDALSNPEGHLSKAKGWYFNALVDLSFFITGLFHSASCHFVASRPLPGAAVSTPCSQRAQLMCDRPFCPKPHQGTILSPGMPGLHS